MPTSPISVLITTDYDIPQYIETTYDTLLRTQAHRHGAMLHETDYVMTRAVSYPHWEKDRAAPVWIINPKLAKIKEEYPSDLPKLRSGALIHLCDEDLAEHSYGFELHSAHGRQGKMSWREFGFHICEFELHLYTITAHRPLPIPVQKMYVAVPDYLVAEEEMLEETNFCTLEQQYIKGEYAMRAPLHPWEKKKGWKHPAKKRIQEFLRGEREGFVEEWNSEFINKMV
jgi:hypothetical protein